MRELIDLVTESLSGSEPTCGAIVSAKMGDEFDEVTHYFLKTEDGYRRLLNHGLQGGVFAFEPTSEFVSNLDDYHSPGIVYPAPQPGERIKTPVQLLGFPETTTFISPGGRPMRRFGDKIEYEGAQYGLEAISTMTRLAEGVEGIEGDTPADMTHIHNVLSALRKNPLAPFIRIFGSAGKVPPEKVPGDIDAFVDLSEVTLDPQTRKQAVNDLLAIAFKNYGAFDPFILTKKNVGKDPDGKPIIHMKLWTRDDHAQSWIVANRGAALTKAGRAGIPLDQVNLGIHEKAATKRGERFVKKHKQEFKDRYGDAWKHVLYATANKKFKD